MSQDSPSQTGLLRELFPLPHTMGNMRAFLPILQARVNGLNALGAWEQDVRRERNAVNLSNQLEALHQIAVIEAQLNTEKASLVEQLRARGLPWDAIAGAANLPSARIARSRWDTSETERDALRRDATARARFRPRLKPSDLPGISVPDAALALDISTSTVYARSKRGELATVRIPKMHSDGVWLRVVSPEALTAHSIRISGLTP